MDPKRYRQVIKSMMIYVCKQDRIGIPCTMLKFQYENQFILCRGEFFQALRCLLVWWH